MKYRLINFPGPSKRLYAKVLDSENTCSVCFIVFKTGPSDCMSRFRGKANNVKVGGNTKSTSSFYYFYFVAPAFQGMKGEGE